MIKSGLNNSPLNTSAGGEQFNEGSRNTCYPADLRGRRLVARLRSQWITLVHDIASTQEAHLLLCCLRLKRLYLFNKSLCGRLLDVIRF